MVPGKLTRVETQVGAQGGRRLYDDITESHSVAPMRDGGLVATGGGEWENLALLKTDMSGNVLWMRHFLRLSDSRACQLGRRTTEGSLLWACGLGIHGREPRSRARMRTASCCGTDAMKSLPMVLPCGKHRTAGSWWPRAMHWLRLDENGDSLWAVECGADYVELTPDHCCISSGAVDGHTTLTKVDSSGSVLWSRVLGVRPVYGGAVKVLPDGGYVLAGDSADKALTGRLMRPARQCGDTSIPQ